MKEVGAEIRRKRQGRGWTGAQLAVYAGMAPSAVSQIETGRRSPNYGSLTKIARALEIEVVDLFPKGQSPLPLDEPERATGIEVGEAYFVPLEEGEEEDVATLRIYYVQLFEGPEPVLRAMREASPEEAAKMRRQRERAGRARE